MQQLLTFWKSLTLSESQSTSIHGEHERKKTQEMDRESRIERPPELPLLKWYSNGRFNGNIG